MPCNARLHPIPLILTTLFFVTPTAAQERLPPAGAPIADATQTAGAPENTAAPTGPATILGPVNSTATRGNRAEVDTPATVTVITGEQLERQNATRPQDTIRYEPGISFGIQPNRTGVTNFVIRGIGENRVRVQVDGIRLPDFPGSNAGAGTYTRDFVDLETVRRLEIVRGPASALYGSDALGGVVAYYLKDPADYLAGTGRNSYFSLRGGYSGADNSISETITGAARAGNVEGMLLYTRRDRHETTPNGSLSANPRTYFVNDVLGRVLIRGENADVLRFTSEFFERVTKTDVRTDRGITPGGGGPSIIVFNSQGRDRSWRGLLAVDYTREAPLAFIDRTELRAYWTEVNRREQTNVERATYFGPTPPTAPTRLRQSDFRFIEPIIGTDSQFTSTASLLGVQNRLTYGTTLDYTTVSRPRDRQETNLITGMTTNTVAGETYPNKNFPDTGIVQFGAYVQDELRFGALSILPAVRVDYYGLTPHPDAAFRRSAQSGPALDVKALDAVAVSPKFGAVYRFDNTWSVYGQYAHGFRAPPYDNANFGFTNAVFGFQILPSANLKPETSNGIEAGIRGRWANSSSIELVGFYNRYRDFIDTVVVGRSSSGLTQFQYQNINSVTIGGIEARGQWQISEQVAVRGSAAWAQGENNVTHAPLDSVDPVRFVTGVAWEHPSGFGAEAISTFALRHDRVSASNLFRAPSYAVLDLAVHYKLAPLLTINAGLFNVTNTKYFVSQDVIGVAANNPRINLYAQPVRYAAVNAVVRW